MPRQSNIFQIFVASPSDVVDERSILEIVVSQLNHAWSSNLGVSFELLKWETDVHPSFSLDPQAVVNEQIGHDYDVFIGIFWGRVGSPTPRAESGTIEEFQRAYTRYQSTQKSPEIMLYFKDAPISPSKIDTQQLEKVQRFRSSLSDKGGLYSVFEDQASFESSVRAHLAAVAQKFSAQMQISSITTSANAVGLHSSNLPPASEEDDYGFIDYLEIYESRQAEMNAAITAINEATERIGEQIRQRTAEIQNNAPADVKAARRHFKRTAEDMNSYAETMAIHNTVMSNSQKLSFSALSNALVLRNEFESGDQDLCEMRGALRSVMESSTGAKESMKGMRGAADSLPRMSKELNQAKRAVVTRLDEFISEVDSINATVANIIEAIDRMLQMKDK